MKRPPKWADRFLKWYCRPQLLEEIQGDAYELFYRTIDTDPEWKARLQFSWNILRFFRWRNIRKDRLKDYTPTSTAMIKNYFITGFRSMLRNLTPSLINITGLSVALGCAVMIFILEDSYFNLDAMHEKGERIHLVVNKIKEGDDNFQSATSPQPLALLLTENQSVEKAVRARRYQGAVRVNETVFRERMWFVDPDFMNVFSFRLITGNRQALFKRDQILLTEEKAKVYFGNANPIGQSLSIKFDDEHKSEFIVGGIIEDTPANSSMYFSFLLPMEVYESIHPDRVNDWSIMSSVSFVLLKEGATADQLNSSLAAYKKNQNLAEADRQVQDTELIPLKEVADRSYEISDSLSWSNHPAAMIAFVVIACLLVLLACFNYMNVSVASVSIRLKEIGIRKVVGSGKKEIIQQFLTENLLLCFIALVLGTGLAYFFLVPGFNSLYEIKFAFKFSSWTTILVFFGSLLFLVALISGAYPALYVSSFNAIKILKGKEKFGNKSTLSKVLLSLQFTLSITALVACLVFIWASYYFEDRDWGYQKEGTIVVPVLSLEQYNGLKDQAATNKNIVSVAGTSQHIGKTSLSEVVDIEEQKINVEHFAVGFNYLETMNIRLKEGRLFDESITSDKMESVIVNEKFVRAAGWDKALNQTFKLDSTSRYVVGVVDDFLYDDFFNPSKPIIITVAPQEKFNFIAIKAESGNINTVSQFMKESWKDVAPDDPYTGFLQNEVFDSFINGNKANNKVLYFISGVAVLLSAMGLYGLVSYNLTRRMKEFSIRKVFGANVITIFRLMNRDYLWIVLISFAVGAPFGAYLMNLLLKAAYAFDIPVNIWPYVISITVMVVTVGLTISSQLRRVIKENPTATLRSE